MPSSSPAQARFMQAIAHGWHKPGGGGPPISVAKEFVAADKEQKMEDGYAEGGEVMPYTHCPHCGMKLDPEEIGETDSPLEEAVEGELMPGDAIPPPQDESFTAALRRRRY